MSKPTKPKQTPGTKVMLVRDHERGRLLAPIPKGSIGVVGKSRPFDEDHSVVGFDGFGFYHVPLANLRPHA